ncbi:MAG: hypothetical protein K8953_08770 [Proteobacteria bacterium]|nr:hypothetical protein [Pseudomonadota bacterium]
MPKKPTPAQLITAGYHGRLAYANDHAAEGLCKTTNPFDTTEQAPLANAWRDAYENEKMHRELQDQRARAKGK